MSPRCPTAVGAHKTPAQRSPPPSFLSLFFSFSTPLDRTAHIPPCAARTLENKCRENNATVGLLSSLARSDVPPPMTAVGDRRVERPLRRQAASMSAALALALRGILRARAQERVDGSRLRRRSRRRRVHRHQPLRRSRSPRARRRLVAVRQASSPRARQPPRWHFTSLSSPRPTHAKARRPSRRIAYPSAEHVVVDCAASAHADDPALLERGVGRRRSPCERLPRPHATSVTKLFSPRPRARSARAHARIAI